jgi:hypothetical protein
MSEASIIKQNWPTKEKPQMGSSKSEEWDDSPQGDGEVNMKIHPHVD